MAAPNITEVYPNDNDTGIPIGASLTILFDRGVDLQTIKDHVVLYGKDFDQTSGPNSALWIDEDTGSNPYFLNSPGFKGLVPFDVKLVYWDLDADEEVDPGAITSEADEAAYGVSGVGHKAFLTPSNGSLAPDVEYSWHIIGDPDGTDTGVSSRTVFDVEEDPGNSSTTGDMVVAGQYAKDSADTVHVKITTSGDIGTAKYKWWYESLGEGSATVGRVTSRRYRRTQDGLQLRFAGSGFVSGDIYSFNVEPLERLATNTKVAFTTNDGTYTDAPDSPSTPAASSPASSVFIPGGSTAAGSTLYLLESTPQDGSYNNSTATRTFTLLFDEDIDASTITDETVTVTVHDVEGHYGGTKPPKEFSKKLIVSGNELKIEI